MCRRSDRVIVAKLNVPGLVRLRGPPPSMTCCIEKLKYYWRLQRCWQHARCMWHAAARARFSSDKDKGATQIVADSDSSLRTAHNSTKNQHECVRGCVCVAGNCLCHFNVPHTNSAIENTSLRCSQALVYSVIDIWLPMAC